MLTYVDAKSVAWMTSHLGGSAYQQIGAYNANINTSPPGWFRAVLRVGFLDLNGNGLYDSSEFWDYHWWYQTNEDNGIWADKPGSTASRKEAGSAGVDPASMTWSVLTPNGTLYYSSTGRYYQIKDIRTVSW